MRVSSVAVLLVVAAPACAPSESSPISTVAVTFNVTKQQYQLSQVQLTTIYPADGGSLTGLTGSVAQFIGGAEVDVDADDPALSAAQTEYQVQQATLQNPGGGVLADFVNSGGVLWPADFQSQNMVSTYYNFERAYAFYNTLGWTGTGAGTPPVYYWVDFIEGAPDATPLTDNAAYSSLIGGFLILPFQNLQSVPLAMNLGVIGHEYSHYQFSYRVFDAAPVAKYYTDWAGADLGTVSPAANVLKSIDEGFADFFGVGATCGVPMNPAACRPNFLIDSIPGIGQLRDVSVPACYTTALDTQVQGDTLSDFIAGSYEYTLGTVFSSALWAAAHDPNLVAAQGQVPALQATQQVLYDSLDVDIANDPIGLSLASSLALYDTDNLSIAFTADWGAASIIVAHVVDNAPLGTALCNALMTQLGTMDNSTPDSTGESCEGYCNATTGWAGGGNPPHCICACQQYPLSQPGTCQ